jgi:hypothetical protein
MAKCLKFARPIVRRGASLYANQAWWQLLKECQDVTTLQLTANGHLASGKKPLTPVLRRFAAMQSLVAIGA